MPADPVDDYKKLLAKEQHENDQYVIIDAKWFEHWKRFVGIEKAEDELEPPGPLDFEKLVDRSTVNHPDGVQLRADALEGNDFAFVPLELFRQLADKYSQNGREIIRKVIPTQTGGFGTTIEIFLVPLRICDSRANYKSAMQIYRSRRTKLDDLKRDICYKFYITDDVNRRLMVSTHDNGEQWEPLDDRAGLVLADVELTANAYITCESSVSFSTGVPSYALTKYSYTPGLCGLSNLGNTCFMNSALQCLSNVPALTDYFRRKEYIEHINRDNPLGMRGDVAQAYGDLIADVWSGTTNYVAPKSLKQNVARYAPQFSGYAQQDSQEFMSFLLDGLHEDLNLVKKKPYVEKIDDDGKTSDVELATQQWEFYRKRNQSKIHDIFHGQIKSTVKCLHCGKEGRTFDPICFLSLPLPERKRVRVFEIDYVRLNGQVKSYRVKCNENGRMRNLIADFCKQFQPKERTEVEPMDSDDTVIVDDEPEDEDPTKAADYDGHQPKVEHVLATEIYNHRIHLQYRDDAPLSNIIERDHVAFFEVADSLKKDNSESILMPVAFRSDDSFHEYFGMPIYVSVPRQHCTGQDIQNALQVRHRLSSISSIIFSSVSRRT